ncbi:hypothetical protein CC78DRAFT_575153 [Lojkania enalia]|uniref:Uncharacterized protein n=1 Tax=Lojkania enalia TaxID=147567 RepID=A0A9P4NAF2_9PLEO|nr:hypothetical protein CC78DRAFT_575153 [Didymosphaeria enalia]
MHPPIHHDDSRSRDHFAIEKEQQRRDQIVNGEVSQDLTTETIHLTLTRVGFRKAPVKVSNMSGMFGRQKLQLAPEIASAPTL